MRARTYPTASRSVNHTCPRISVVMPGASSIDAHVWALSNERGRSAVPEESALIEGGMSAQSDPRRALALDVDPKYYYRRVLSVRELLPAFGAAVGVALVTFYVVKLFIERTPFDREPRVDGAPRLISPRSERSSATARNVGRR